MFRFLRLDITKSLIHVPGERGFRYSIFSRLHQTDLQDSRGASFPTFTFSQIRYFPDSILMILGPNPGATKSGLETTKKKHMQFSNKQIKFWGNNTWLFEFGKCVWGNKQQTNELPSNRSIEIQLTLFKSITSHWIQYIITNFS